MDFTAGGIKSTCEAIKDAAKAANAPAPAPSIAPAPATSAAPVPAPVPVTMVAPAFTVTAPTPAERIEMMKLELAMKQADAEKEKAKAEQLRHEGQPSAGAAPAKIAEKGQSAVESQGGGGKRGRSEKEAPVGGPKKKLNKVKGELVKPNKLALAKKMRGYMIEVRSRAIVTGAEMAKVGEKPKRGSWICTMSKCSNTYSGSTVSAEGVAGTVGIGRS